MAEKMTSINSKIDYLAWNDALGEYFFSEDKAGKEVLLYVNDDIINEIGKTIGADRDHFVESVKQGPVWAYARGFCQRAIKTYWNWRSRDFKYPPYIAYLAFFVLAAGLEGDFAPHAYYPRLRKLLGEDDYSTPPSFERMIELWDDLEKWSREDKHEEWGRFVARIRGNWWKVGLPWAQTLISDDERRYFPDIFAAAHLDPADPPPPELIPRILREYGGPYLEKKTWRVINASKDDGQILKKALIEFVLDALEDWDGTVVEEETGEAEAAGQTFAGLRLCLKFDGMAKTVQCHLRMKTPKVFPEEGLFFSFQGRRWFCNEAHQGWSSVLKDVSLRPPEKFDASTLDWRSGVEFFDEENGWKARLRGESVRLFVDGSVNEHITGWIGTQTLQKGIPFYVVAFGSDVEKVAAWGKTSCKVFRKEDYDGFPEGCTLFYGEDAFDSCPGIDCLSVSSSMRLLLRGGVKIGQGNMYLNFAPPSIVLENSSGEEKVRINDDEITPVKEGIPVWALPNGVPLNEPLRIEVFLEDSIIAKRVVRLTEAVLAVSFDETPSRDALGNLVEENNGGVAQGCIVPDTGEVKPYPKLLPYHLSEKIYFVGNQAGYIVEWPSKSIQEWHPVWALTKKGKKNFDVYYCGNSMEPPEMNRKADKRDRKKWKELLWVRRRVVDIPRLGCLRKLWKIYQEAAKHV